MAVPPGVSATDFAEALEQFENVIGKEWVFTSDADMDLYRDAYSPLWHEKEDRVPSAALAPDRVEQVQAIARIANKYRIPLWTFSTGRNLAYGGSAPALSGSVVLDLKRMNRILEIDEHHHYAVVEPGVSYFDLYRYIQEHKLNLWIDPADPGWGSPMGNALDRGGGRTPMRNHFDAICGMEVVLANGELLRTGMGAMPNSKVWHLYKFGFGPYVDGLFTQSNFGIVTRVGIWLMPAPEAYLDARVSVPRHDDLVPFMENYVYLMNSDILRGTMMLESPLLNYRAMNGGTVFTMPGGPTKAENDRLAQEQNLPYWSAELRFWGPQKLIQTQWECVKDQYANIPGVSFQDGRNYRFPVPEKDIATNSDVRAALGIPNLGVFGLLQGVQGHVGFSPIIPMTGEAIFEALKAFGDMYAKLGIFPSTQFSALPWSYYHRALVFLFGIPMYQDVEKNRENRAIFKHMVATAAEHGWCEYRTHIAFMDTVADSYTFNNHALHRFHETLKDAVDPNGILSPGKSGIWPKHMRKDRP